MAKGGTCVKGKSKGQVDLANTEVRPVYLGQRRAAAMGLREEPAKAKPPKPSKEALKRSSVEWYRQRRKVDEKQNMIKSSNRTRRAGNIVGVKLKSKNRKSVPHLWNS